MPSLNGSEAQFAIIQEQVMDPLHKIVRLLTHVNIASSLALLAWLAMANDSARARVDGGLLNQDSSSAAARTDR